MLSSQNYSFSDRVLHQIAFSSYTVQKVIGEIESNLYRSKFSSINSSNEVFVSSLPRSGTTLLLELFFQTGEFKTFSYRNMPFVLAPILWRKLSSPFLKLAQELERAHGDGMTVSFDSPEAFEEVIWLAYLEKKIVDEKFINILSADDISSEFVACFQNTIKKLLLDDAQESDSSFRYLSKNNANCSRIGVIKRLFPTASIVVPFRNPFAHVSSLLAQHTRFYELHKDDVFARKYMKWLGHYDFGINFKPINYDNWLADTREADSFSMEFWIKYWIASYRYIIENQRESVLLFDYDGLLANPEQSLEILAESVGVSDIDGFVLNKTKLRTPTSKPIEQNMIDEHLIREVESVYSRLQKAAINY